MTNRRVGTHLRGGNVLTTTDRPEDRHRANAPNRLNATRERVSLRPALAYLLRLPAGIFFPLRARAALPCVPPPRSAPRYTRADSSPIAVTNRDRPHHSMLLVDLRAGTCNRALMPRSAVFDLENLKYEMYIEYCI